MNTISSTPGNGHYTVSNEIFFGKIYALLKASELKTDLKFHYYDDIFEKAGAKGQLAHVNLKDLYAERARQLRDTFDCLILNYSGGSDSHNILHTFLENNIKLDYIFVQWPLSLVDKGIYTPNADDKTNYNFHSEWDLVIKKDLEYLSQYHPEIKIEIDDWTDRVNENFYGDHLFEKNVSLLPSITRSIKMNSFSKIENDMIDKGKRVANIFGVDKTMIMKSGQDWNFYFLDSGFMSQANPKNPDGIQYFYHTPAAPDITVAQAYKIKAWFEKHPEKQYLITPYEVKVKTIPGYAKKTYSELFDEYKEYSEIYKLVCYPYWDFTRFQADKPFYNLHKNLQLGVRPWDNILTVLPGFKRAQEAWAHHWKSYLNVINLGFMRNENRDSPVKTKLFKME